MRGFPAVTCHICKAAHVHAQLTLADFVEMRGAGVRSARTKLKNVHGAHEVSHIHDISTHGHDLPNRIARRTQRNEHAVRDSYRINICERFRVTRRAVIVRRGGNIGGE